MSTKAALANRLARKRNISRREAMGIVDGLLDSLREAMLTGNKVALVGFGTFDLRMRRARKGRNPRNNTALDVPPKAVIMFRPGKELRHSVSGDADGETAPESKDGPTKDGYVKDGFNPNPVL